MAEPSGRNLWSVENRVPPYKIASGSVSECEFLYVYVFMCDGGSRGSVCGIELRTSHAENLGVVPMTMYF